MLVVWLLTGNSLDDGKSGELVHFTHLVYEAATGDENGKGLRDKIAIARKKVREWFVAQAAQEDMRNTSRPRRGSCGLKRLTHTRSQSSL